MYLPLRYIGIPPLTGASTAPLSAIDNGFVLIVDRSVFTSTIYLLCNSSNSRVFFSTSITAFSTGEISITCISTISDRRRIVGKTSAHVKIVFSVHKLAMLVLLLFSVFPFPPLPSLTTGRVKENVLEKCKPIH